MQRPIIFILYTGTEKQLSCFHKQVKTGALREKTNCCPQLLMTSVYKCTKQLFPSQAHLSVVLHCTKHANKSE